MGDNESARECIEENMTLEPGQCWDSVFGIDITVPQDVSQWSEPKIFGNHLFSRMLNAPWLPFLMILLPANVMRYRNTGLSMSTDAEADEYSRYGVDGESVAVMKSIIERHHV